MTTTARLDAAEAAERKTCEAYMMAPYHGPETELARGAWYAAKDAYLAARLAVAKERAAERAAWERENNAWIAARLMAADR